MRRGAYKQVSARDGAYPFDLVQAPERQNSEATLVVDTRPLICAVVRDAARDIGGALIARRFHSAMVELIAAVCGQLRTATGLGAVVLSGGVFMNALLTREVACGLATRGFRSTAIAWYRLTMVA
jgi:hydrogenase maturation protein HypF